MAKLKPSDFFGAMLGFAASTLVVFFAISIRNGLFIPALSSLVSCVVGVYGAAIFMNRRRWPNAASLVKPDSFKGKIVLITGPTAGLGFETTRCIVNGGVAKIILCARNLEKLERVKNTVVADAIEKKVGKKEEIESRIVCLACDLDDLASVKSCCEAVKKLRLPKLDIIIANAGIMALPDRETSKQGIEKQIACNHVAHQYLVLSLLGELKKGFGVESTPARVVSLSSSAYGFSDMSFVTSPDLENSNYVDVYAYGNSKAANMLFSYEVHARESKGTKGGIMSSGTRPITAFSLMPGVIGTDLSRSLSVPNTIMWYLMLPLIGKTVEQGTATTIHCCLHANPETEGGLYFDHCAASQKDMQTASKMVTKKVSGLASKNDPLKAAAELLYNNTNELLKKKGYKV